MNKQSKPFISALAAICLLGLGPRPAHAWGDQGHRVIGLVADHYLDAAVRTKVQSLLSGDSTHLTPSTGIADEATWADKWRDSQGHTGARYLATHNWHFVDIELDGSADLAQACAGPPASPVVSDGPADDCVVERVEAFALELENPATSQAEQRKALQFLLHFVGDLHQPLHASDDHDSGGNAKKVKADAINTGTLHHYWDSEFVNRLGSNPQTIANSLVNGISAGQLKSWRQGNPRTWATQSHSAGKIYGYDPLGEKDQTGKYLLSAKYVTNATNVSARQLARAGVRLAKVLNDALGN